MLILSRDAPDVKGEGAWRGPDPPLKLSFRNVPEPSPELLTPCHLHVLAQRMNDRITKEESIYVSMPEDTERLREEKAKFGAEIWKVCICAFMFLYDFTLQL